MSKCVSCTLILRSNESFASRRVHVGGNSVSPPREIGAKARKLSSERRTKGGREEKKKRKKKRGTSSAPRGRISVAIFERGRDGGSMLRKLRSERALARTPGTACTSKAATATSRVSARVIYKSNETNKISKRARAGKRADGRTDGRSVARALRASARFAPCRLASPTRQDVGVDPDHVAFVHFFFLFLRCRTSCGRGVAGDRRERDSSRIRTSPSRVDSSAWFPTHSNGTSLLRAAGTGDRTFLNRAEIHARTRKEHTKRARKREISSDNTGRKGSGKQV